MTNKDMKAKDMFRANWTFDASGKGTCGAYYMRDFTIWCDGDKWHMTAPNGKDFYTAKHLATIASAMYRED